MQSKVAWIGGKQQEDTLGQQFKPVYRNEYTGEALDQALVEAAIADEMKHFNQKVWHLATRDDAERFEDKIVVGGRWVVCNKGGTLNPKIRCRYVATEVNKGGSEDAFYAATPPLEAKRLLLSQFAHSQTTTTDPNKKLKLCLVDGTKAYFNAEPNRNIFVRLPKEMGMPVGTLGKLVRCAYGTRDAGARWE